MQFNRGYARFGGGGGGGGSFQGIAKNVSNYIIRKKLTFG